MECNAQLALERAQAVRRVLLNLSFPEHRLRAVSLATGRRSALTQRICAARRTAVFISELRRHCRTPKLISSGCVDDCRCL